jgi:D-3-phosphoglycerate dehydrogenase
MAEQKILITDKVHPVMVETLEHYGFRVEYRENMALSELPPIIGQYHGIIINSKIILDKELIDRAGSLAWVARLGSGMEIIDVPYCKKKKIKVVNAPEGNANAVAEHEIGMLLSLLNHLPRCDREVRQGIWHREKNRGQELKGKTLGIIGLGHTGSALATKMSSWGLSVYSYDKYRKRYPASLRFVHKVDLEELKRKADIISFHLPLTDETRYLIDEPFLAGCKPGVIISNTSRGKICRTTDLIKGLVSGYVTGACLDVFENEKPETYSDEEKAMYEKLFSMENVVLSPHVAGWTRESLYEISAVILRKLGLDPVY